MGLDVVSWLALIFLTLFGYSVGAVLGAQGSGKGEPDAGLLDVVGVLLVWIGAVVTRLTLISDKWLAIGVWLVLAIVVGAVFNLRTGPASGSGAGNLTG